MAALEENFAFLLISEPEGRGVFFDHLVSGYKPQVFQTQERLQTYNADFFRLGEGFADATEYVGLEQGLETFVESLVVGRISLNAAQE